MINKLLLLVPAASAGLFLCGCADEPYYGRVAGGPGYYGDRGYADPGYAPGPGYDAPPPGYYGGPAYGGPYAGSDDVDFYFVGGVPYSRDYGPLVFRDNRYYYARGGTYYTYDRNHVSGRHYAYGGNNPGYRRGPQGQAYRGNLRPSQPAPYGGQRPQTRQKKKDEQR